MTRIRLRKLLPHEHFELFEQYIIPAGACQAENGRSEKFSTFFCTEVENRAPLPEKLL